MTHTADAAPSPSAPFGLRGRVVLPREVIEDGLVVVDGGTLAWVGAADDASDAGFADALAAADLPVAGTTLLPGLVDVHDHGGGGASFPDADDAETALLAVHEHRRHGTTSIVASLVTAPRDVLLRRVGLLADLADAGEVAGIHLEGPFLSEVRCGAQNPSDMLAGDPELVRAIAEAARGHLVTMTVAPEVAGVQEPGGVIDTLVEVGAIPSIGHTDAHWDAVRSAVEAGTAALARAGEDARSGRLTATHLFNGMRPLHHRDPGPIAGCLDAAARGELVVELVGDGTHLDPGVVKTVFDLVGADAIMLVTDAMAAAGMPDGSYQLGPMAVVVADGVARLADAANPGGGAIAGGTAHLLDVVRHTVIAGVPLADAVRAASLTPAGVLGRTDVGALEAGRRADVVVTDADLQVVSVLRGGERVAG
ncbi:N-acetylglucosamine-6-phosphate deacetylase [Luteimicrobium subarcticum]|uniref:N-acetylglucosamine 6-phosphate deacetylase n=1 Tax=Luteimicrobium subarcticum TaxID=620910 RepID=A0A2M8W1K0_9MICO|nr:amidohydrolase family protein [Luteimicrobium subarcticum]PJI84778.1 N-acetylglucosamine 6-phosphate deacetylase [Luteimicrobium subarcticum]